MVTQRYVRESYRHLLVYNEVSVTGSSAGSVFLVTAAT